MADTPNPLPDLDGPDAKADRLVALVHGCMDWDVWGGARRVRYWDALVENTRAACYAGPTVADWWEAMARRMQCGWPYDDSDRAELAVLMAIRDHRPVLDSLRRRAEMLVLRQRVRSDMRKADYERRHDDE